MLCGKLLGDERAQNSKPPWPIGPSTLEKWDTVLSSVGQRIVNGEKAGWISDEKNNRAIEVTHTMPSTIVAMFAGGGTTAFSGPEGERA